MTRTDLLAEKAERRHVETLVTAGRKASNLYAQQLERVIAQLLMTGTKPEAITVTSDSTTNDGGNAVIASKVLVESEPVWSLTLTVSRCDLKVASGQH